MVGNHTFHVFQAAIAHFDCVSVGGFAEGGGVV